MRICKFSKFSMICKSSRNILKFTYIQIYVYIYNSENLIRQICSCETSFRQICDCEFFTIKFFLQEQKFKYQKIVNDERFFFNFSIKWENDNMFCMKVLNFKILKIECNSRNSHLFLKLLETQILHFDFWNSSSWKEVFE